MQSRASRVFAFPKARLSAVLSSAAALLVAAPASAQYEWSLVGSTLLQPTEVLFVDLDQDGLDDFVGASLPDGLIVWSKAQFGGGWGPMRVLSREVSGVREMVSLDFDGDGDLDLVAACDWSRQLSLHENLGGGQFAPRVQVDSGTDRVLDVTAFDADGDGDLDLVAALSGLGVLALYEDTGVGFGPRQTIVAAAGDVRDVDAADLDGDGDQDLVYVDAGTDSFFTLENAGGGTFGAPSLLVAGDSQSRAVAIGDPDGDGELEIVTGARTVRLFQRMAGSGLTYTMSTSAQSSAEISALESVDVTDDGVEDVIFGGVSGSTGRFLFDQATSQFSYFPQFLGFTRAEDFAVRDLNGDGRTDVVAANFEVQFILGQGGDAFSARENLFGSFESIYDSSFVDIDDDGDLDLLGGAFHVPAFPSTDPYRAALVWREREDTEQFSVTKVLYESAQFISQPQAADVDQDGLLDVVYLIRQASSAQDPYDVAWQRSRGVVSGSLEFDDPVVLTALPNTGSESASLVVADQDDDGDPDIAVSAASGTPGATLSTLENLGGGQFGALVLVDSDENLRLLHVADVNGDRLADLVATSRSHALRVYLASTTSPTGFAAPIRAGGSSIASQTEIAAVDVDADGDLDFLVSKDTVGPSSLAFYENLGSTVGAAQVFQNSAGNEPNFFQVDLDGDGDEDVLVQVNRLSRELWWFENAGGTIQPISIFGMLDPDLPGSPWGVDAMPGLLAATDVDGDADLDFLVGIYSHIRLYRQTGSLGSVTCAPEPNSVGAGALMTVTGSDIAAADAVVLGASALPPAATTLFLVSGTAGFTPNPGTSQGTLCLGGAIGRYVAPGQVQSSNESGTAQLRIPLTETPHPALGLLPIVAGDTVYFQAWYRDANPGATSNFSEAVRVLFR